MLRDQTQWNYLAYNQWLEDEKGRISEKNGWIASSAVFRFLRLRGGLLGFVFENYRDESPQPLDIDRIRCVAPKPRRGYTRASPPP